ncbi:N-acetylmuramoyl-L-alanine amidase family protein [Paenibacillus gallinarum]|uniref:N-acetylmuramoyl-L-alanine amidase n=1 Tax=Paenibacillus gallinarum TaxID=2762232 RepID=A0ABR8SW92_9BACL|nr:N-acetylmuramoyl-L-alanine amidase [Paenibacillus gallinarum]MBD7967778.1 N-acetylmuramoyl-L-alanine amidase [Paenibacillus gallinarum]
MIKLEIDPGHGGKDGGAAGNGLKEKDIALIISKGIKKKLEDEYEGVKVTLTRNTDIFLELKERTNKANAAGVDALISVHCNAGGGSGGFESFRHTNASAKSKELQEALHTAIMAELNPFNVIDRKQKTGNLHMVRESKMPAVLTENLFIDVAADANRLKNDKVIEALINGHVIGVAKYFGLKKKKVAKVANERDINVVSPWAKTVWEEMTKEGYFDGKRPGAPITREEMAVVVSRLLNNNQQK